jgi:hypothetical protein
VKRLLVLVLVLAGCKNQASQATPAPSASTAPSASASVAAGPPKPVDWTGTYTATSGTLYVPDAAGYEGFKFRGEDAGAIGTGEGSLSFTVDPDGGIVTGKLEGPLGPSVVTGIAQNGELSFHVAPASESETAFRGTGTASIDGGTATGEIHASTWHANILRDATFTVKAQPAK